MISRSYFKITPARYEIHLHPLFRLVLEVSYPTFETFSDVRGCQKRVKYEEEPNAVPQNVSKPLLGDIVIRKSAPFVTPEKIVKFD